MPPAQLCRTVTAAAAPAMRNSSSSGPRQYTKLKRRLFQVQHTTPCFTTAIKACRLMGQLTHSPPPLLQPQQQQQRHLRDAYCRSSTLNICAVRPVLHWLLLILSTPTAAAAVPPQGWVTSSAMIDSQPGSSTSRTLAAAEPPLLLLRQQCTCSSCGCGCHQYSCRRFPG